MKKSYSNLRSLLFVCAVFLLSNFYSFTAFGQCDPAALDTTFNSNDVGYASGEGADDRVKVLARQSDGKLIIAGDFDSYQSRTVNKIARIYPNGILDTTFSVGRGFEGIQFAAPEIRSVKVQADGKILVGGSLGSFNSVDIESYIRLLPNGDIDPSFYIPSSTTVNSDMSSANVQSIEVLPNGKIMLMGVFYYNQGFPNRSIIRLNQDGTIDNTFSALQIYPSTNTGRIYSMAFQADGKIIIGGDSDNGMVARLNSDGSLDNSFMVTSQGYYSDERVNSIAIQSDGKIVVGGLFNSLRGQPANCITRLNTDGTRDTTFVGTGISITTNLGPRERKINEIIVDSNDKIIIAGSFGGYNGQPNGYHVRLNPNGSLDNSFVTDTNNEVYDMLVLPNQDVMLAINNGQYPESYVKRIHPNGAKDETFNQQTGAFFGGISDVLELPDGKMLIDMAAYAYNGVRAIGLVRIFPNGDLDTTFTSPPTIRNISSLALQSDGKILVASRSVNDYLGSSRDALIRLNPNGTLDPSFTFEVSSYSSFTGSIEVMKIQPDGKILLGSNLRGTASGDPEIGAVSRINPDGSPDVTFNANVYSIFNGIAHDIVLHPNGQIGISGGFDYQIAGSNRSNLARINADGTLDTSFNPARILGTLYSLHLLPTNQYLISSILRYDYNRVGSIVRINPDGSFDNSFSTEQGNTITRMKVKSNGKIIVYGSETYGNRIVNNIFQLNADGSFDTDFQTTGVNASIYGLTLLSNEQIMIGGDFTAYNGIGRNRIAKIGVSTPASPTNVTLPNNQYSLCLNDSTVLSVTGQGTLFWYDSTLTNRIATGNTLVTPPLTADSTYFYVKDSTTCGVSNFTQLLVTTIDTFQINSYSTYVAYLDSTGNIEINARELDSLSRARCGDSIVSYLFHSTGSPSQRYSCTNTITQVWLRITDNNGNIDTAQTIIQLRDTLAPIAIVQELVIQDTVTSITISARDFLVTLYDNCTDSSAIIVRFVDTGSLTRVISCNSSASSTYRISATDLAGNTSYFDVFIRPSRYDLSVNLVAFGFRPAQGQNSYIQVSNNSCLPVSGKVSIILDPLVSYIPTQNPFNVPTTITGNTITWDFDDLALYRADFIRNLSLLADSSLNIGDSVCFTVSVTPTNGDTNLSNNQKAYCFPVVNSYDPNDKQVYPQGICTDKFTKRSDLPLTYTIRFQNTGNAPALNVRIADSLSSLLNRRSLRVVGSSHPMVVDTTANNNVINFRFNNINLPDSASNPVGSQGYVIFELSEIAAHTDTSRISNKSYIYFDTNAPIITNTVKNTIVNTLPLCNPAGGGSNPPIADCQLPTNLRTEILSSTKVKLLWTTPTSTNAINYEILRNGQRLNTVPASNLFYIDSTLIANTQYNYSIKAICGNNTATSNSVQVRTLPSTPTLLSVVAACKGEKGRINVQSAGAVYRVYSSQTGTTALFETNNASIETPVLSDSTTFYISVVINGQESQRLKAIVPIKEVFSATIEQGSLLESCATEFTLSAQAVAGATYTWFRENVQVGTERTLTTTFEARYKVRVIKNGCSDESELTTTRFVTAPTAKIKQGNSVSFCGSGILNAQDTSSNVVYEWILNGNVIKTGTSASVSESGTYTLKASQPSCESSVTIAVTITTATANVVLTADETAICSDSETMLSVTSGTGFTYKWFRNNTAISNSSATLSTSEIGTYKVEITTAEGCKVTTSETEITRLQVNQAILRVNTESGKDKTIDVTSQDAIESVKWFKDGVEIPAFANQNLITPTETGNYKAKVVYESGCSFETAEKTFTVGRITGIEEESAKIFTIYPNPNNGSFKVEFATTTNQKTTLTLVDGLGRIIHSQEIAMNERVTNINLPKISAGVYVVQIISEGRVYTKQLIIQ